MATQLITVSATGGSDVIPVDLTTFKYGVGILVNIADGASCDYDVEVSGARRDTPRADRAWNKHDVLVAQNASANGNLAYPVSMLRLFVRAFTGTVTFQVVQVDPGG
jgi:hypothetical protein